MIDATRCESQRRFDVVKLEVRQLFDNLRMGHAGGEEIENIHDAYP